MTLCLSSVCVSVCLCLCLSLPPEEIYGNWSLPLNTSHVWHPRMREVGLLVGGRDLALRVGLAGREATVEVGDVRM